MRKIYYIIIALAFVIGIGIIFFNYDDKDRLPQKGLYFISQNSYYATSEKNMTLCFDFFTVSEKKSEPFENINNFTLIDNYKKEYPVTINRENISKQEIHYNLYNKVEIQKYIIYIPITIKDNINIVEIQYEDKQGNIISENIGNIQIDYIGNDDKNIEALSNRID